MRVVESPAGFDGRRPPLQGVVAHRGASCPGSPRREPREWGSVSGGSTRIPSAHASGFPATGHDGRRPLRQPGASFQAAHGRCGAWPDSHAWRRAPRSAGRQGRVAGCDARRCFSGGSLQACACGSWSHRPDSTVGDRRYRASLLIGAPRALEARGVSRGNGDRFPVDRRVFPQLTLRASRQRVMTVGDRCDNLAQASRLRMVDAGAGRIRMPGGVRHGRRPDLGAAPVPQAAIEVRSGRRRGCRSRRPAGARAPFPFPRLAAAPPSACGCGPRACRSCH